MTTKTMAEIRDEMIYEASKRHCWPRDKISDVYEAGFYNGAKYREDEIKALLEVVKMQFNAIQAAQDFCVRVHEYHDVGNCQKTMTSNVKAITATDEKLKSLGVTI